MSLFGLVTPIQCDTELYTRYFKRKLISDNKRTRKYDESKTLH